LAGNLVKPLMSLYGTEWRERGYGLSIIQTCEDWPELTKTFRFRWEKRIQVNWNLE
jgi:hypothetical protein